MKDIEVLCHSSIKIIKNKIIYIDPFKINSNYMDADVIFITHSHYDHFSENDILKIKNENTIIVITNDLYSKVLELGFNKEKIIIVEPNKKYTIQDFIIETIPAYNVNKKFHPKENGWVGYVVNINEVSYYITGDTDLTNESSNVKCDILFVPIGGTYTMDYIEAAKLTNIVKPKIVIPIHYGDIVGEKENAIEFRNLINNNIKCEILM